ncbi:MAG: ribonuclease E activity regulator RraA [Acidimicrobiales bacterium]|nr:ribonuclease E activity regulator RraA [Acidimicrobiales bacterium]
MTESVPFRPTSDVCDDHDDYDGPLPQILTERFVSLGGRSGFAGVVSTVKAFEDNSVVKDAITEPGEGRVLVIDGGGSLRRSMVGGNVATEAAGNGWAGFVVYAAVRDTHELQATDIGVFALGRVPRKTEKHGVGKRDVPVTFGGATISPGDRIYCDSDGVVVLPPA